MLWASTNAGLRVWLRVAVAGLVWITGVAVGQVSTPPATVEDALHEMSDAAGVIFTGQVTTVRRVAGVNGASGVVEVDFRVDNAVRGCVSGGTYTLREWAGLWAGGNARYRVGQRLLMMLRAPGASGMSSPVGGMDGAIPIRGVESEITTSGITASAANVGSAVAVPQPVQMVDLRWVGTRMFRSNVTGSGSGTTVSGTSVAGTGSGGGSDASVAAQGASVATVMQMLGTWEQARVAQ